MARLNLKNHKKSPLFLEDDASLFLKRKIHGLKIENVIYYVLIACILKSFTFYKNGNLQCNIFCYRSVGDLYRICVGLNIKITIYELMNILFKLTKENKIRMSYCKVIQKRVFFQYRPYNNNRSRLYNHKDEYGLTFYEWGNIKEI